MGDKDCGDEVSQPMAKKRPKILLVDDEIEFLGLLATRLRRRKMDVAGVVTGEQALEALSEWPADIVVLDLRMPGIGGVETLRRIGQDHPSVRVIVVTGYTDGVTAQEVLDLGAVSYLLKPIALEELLRRIRTALEG